ncbi:hypothetical protein BJY52DRAFT_1223303 [Lactarius psammicola]|nr:hypothetical protein BJY52DRAFT_1223303 [Lactarius psammicola]
MCPANADMPLPSTAGFAANHIILGVASYGHSSHVNNDTGSTVGASGNINLHAPFDKSQQPAGDKWGGTADGTDECGNPNVVGSIFDFWGLIDGGFLTNNRTAANGIDYGLSTIAARRSVMVSYESGYDAGIAVFAMWGAGGESDDILLDAINSGISVGY